MPPVLFVVGVVAWAVMETQAGRGPDGVAPWIALGGILVYFAWTGPLNALWALARYRDVYADADARPPLGSPSGLFELDR